MPDTWINLNPDDTVLEIEAAGDAPGEFPELVLRSPEGAKGLEFGAQGFLPIADADVDHVVGVRRLILCGAILSAP